MSEDTGIKNMASKELKLLLEKKIAEIKQLYAEKEEIEEKIQMLMKLVK